MTKTIGLAYADDHSRHIVIHRKVHSFIAQGYRIVVVDQASNHTVQSERIDTYQHLPVNKQTLELLSKYTWPLVGKIPANGLHRTYWTTLLGLRMRINAQAIAHQLLSYPCDLYMAEDLTSLWAAILAQNRRKRPIIYDAHELEAELGLPDDYATRYLRKLQSNLISRAQYLVVPNQERSSYYEASCSLQSQPLVIHNCAPRSNLIRGIRLRKMLGIPDTRHIVLYHGSYIPYRSLDQLVLSADFFGDDVALVMIGESNAYYRNVLQPAYESVRHKERIHWLPYIPHEELQSLVTEADLGVVIYQDINLNNHLCAPLKLYEYIMLGVPVLGSNLPALRSFVEQNAIGVIMHSNTPNDIAQAVNQFFSHTVEARQAYIGALEQAKNIYSWENEAEKWQKLLRLCLPNSSERS